ncbi:MAG: nitroreductase/quinone reductase family protein [Candidatus Limnocylindria bacterium]
MANQSVEHAPALGATPGRPKLPPRWFVRAAWIGHRAIHRFTGGKRGLAYPKQGGRFGYLRLETTGRRSGRERAAILGYIEDGQNLVTLAMNGWADTDPAWWLNLQTQPEATVELKGASRTVRARKAVGEERERLWTAVQRHTGYGDLEEFAGSRLGETPVVVLEPRRG